MPASIYTPRIGLALAALAAVTLMSTLSARADSGTSLARWRPCRDVVVQFQPEGSGGGTEVAAKQIGCTKARETIRSCIKGKLKPGWAGTYRPPKFVLTKQEKKIRYLPVGGGGCIPVSKNGAARDKPTPPAGASRVEAFKPDLNGDGVKERVLVYNRPKEGLPATYFEVWKHKRGVWKRGQRKLVNQSAGSADSGLVKAWTKDLNRDGRFEIATRDFITPSVGEVLSVFRQKSEGSIKFTGLQTVGGDQVVVKPRKGKTALIKDSLKSNHSPDNIEHHEVWKWSKSADQWNCTKDCAT